MFKSPRSLSLCFGGIDQSQFGTLQPYSPQLESVITGVSTLASFG